MVDSFKNNAECLYVIIWGFINILYKCIIHFIKNLTHAYFILINPYTKDLLTNLSYLTYPDVDIEYDYAIEYLKNEIDVRIHGDKLILRLPCRYGACRKNINILNPNIKDNITSRDLYVNELSVIILTGHLNNTLMSYYNNVTDGIINKKHLMICIKF